MTVVSGWWGAEGVERDEMAIFVGLKLYWWVLVVGLLVL